MPNCLACAYWEPDGHREWADRWTQGHCRRHAPTSELRVVLRSGEAMEGRWPVVRARDWCGDWSARPADPPGGPDAV
jgi:hypothetical protein